MNIYERRMAMLKQAETADPETAALIHEILWLEDKRIEELMACKTWEAEERIAPIDARLKKLRAEFAKKT